MGGRAFYDPVLHCTRSTLVRKAIRKHPRRAEGLLSVGVSADKRRSYNYHVAKAKKSDVMSSIAIPELV